MSNQTTVQKVRSWAKVDLEHLSSSSPSRTDRDLPGGHGRPVHGRVAVGPVSAAAVRHRRRRLPRRRRPEADGRLPKRGQPAAARTHARRPAREDGVFAILRGKKCDEKQ